MLQQDTKRWALNESLTPLAAAMRHPITPLWMARISRSGPLQTIIVRFLTHSGCEWCPFQLYTPASERTIHQTLVNPPPMLLLSRFPRVVDSKRLLDKCLLRPHAPIEMATAAHRQVRACVHGGSRELCLLGRASGFSSNWPVYTPFLDKQLPTLPPCHLYVGYKCTTYTKGESTSRSWS